MGFDPLNEPFPAIETIVQGAEIATDMDKVILEPMFSKIYEKAFKGKNAIMHFENCIFPDLATSWKTLGYQWVS